MLGFWINAFLFSGGFLKPDFIIMPFRKIVDITPLFYAMRSFIYLEFHGTTWSGAHPTAEGFACNQPGFCYGHTGEQVLASLSQSFSSATGDHVGTDAAVLLLMASIFKIICFVTIVLRTHGAGPLTRSKTSASMVKSPSPPSLVTLVASSRLELPV